MEMLALGLALVCLLYFILFFVINHFLKFEEEDEQSSTKFQKIPVENQQDPMIG